MDKLTDIDKKDIAEGFKKREPHKWKSRPSLTSEEKLVEFIVQAGGTVDLRTTAKKFEKTTAEVAEVIQDLGYY